MNWDKLVPKHSNRLCCNNCIVSNGVAVVEVSMTANNLCIRLLRLICPAVILITALTLELSLNFCFLVTAHLA